MLRLLSIWFVICSVSLQNFTANAGLLISPISLLAANVITEIYGYKNARRAIWCGFFFNLLSILYGLLTINLPNPSYALYNNLYNSIISTYLKTSFFFILGHLLAESFNVLLFAKLKLKLKGDYLKLRILGSVLFSLFINDFILGFANYFRSLIHIDFFSIVFVNTLTTFICLPVICYIIDKVKKLEKIDIYDQNTQFNFFKVEVQYILSNNKYIN